MKKILILLFCCLSLTAVAQDAGHGLHFGYISYDSALVAMPDYAETQQSLAELRKKYDAEMSRAEEEFNKKYEEFLEGRDDFPASILRKRQRELQELMNRNVTFRQQAREDLIKAEGEAMAPLRSRLDKAIAHVAASHELAFVLNTSQNACPYISPAMGVDITEIVIGILRSKN
jgi:outer membrane protein